MKNAINSMVTEDVLDEFLELLDNISDETIKNYLQGGGQFKLPAEIDIPNTSGEFLIYFCLSSSIIFGSIVITSSCQYETGR